MHEGGLGNLMLERGASDHGADLSMFCRVRVLSVSFGDVGQASRPHLLYVPQTGIFPEEGGQALCGTVENMDVFAKPPMEGFTCVSRIGLPVLLPPGRSRCCFFATDSHCSVCWHLSSRACLE